MFNSRLPRELAQLIDFNPSTLSVSSRESKTREFKEKFSVAALSGYARTLASFANADGGVIIFGVADKPRKIIGIDADSLVDESKWSDRLREDFQPEIPITSHNYTIQGKSVFAVCTTRSPNRPVICRKTRTEQVSDRAGPRDREVIRAGTVYFRYAAQTKHIEYAELAYILQDREERKMKAILDTLKAVERIGYDRVGVVDASNFETPGTATNLYVSRETARSLNFIEKGRFTETKDEGSPAYVVLGTVSLDKVVTAPIDEADQNFPAEVAEQLKELITSIYGSAQKFCASQVTKLLRHYKLEELPYSHYDKKVRRRYITREGIRELKSRIEANPLEAIKVFGSKAAISAFQTRV
jgi:hypothetical protein